ncbi:hypothetical protein [Zobellia sp. 1_MG-2023]|uniref:hypothetical protein n=1 Tax=Zobellia sp. 1_MG-2023 TaxID=3062626 RepID=UPI0026E16271|nr:hypothetical protein [Zobellia sp. 1_MG-2023]MDO6819073.1 hypothetical protein [Zobellia sp. 1_MG-2023]
MNRYIKAMEIGRANEENGITYFDLVKEVEKGLDRKFNESSEATFYDWFTDSFIKKGGNDELKEQMFRWKIRNYFTNKYVNPDSRFKESRDWKDVENILNTHYFLNGITSKQYLDYLELKEARKNAKQATGFSLFSIFVAVAAIVIGAIQSISSPKPPYEVQVIEDRTRTKELQQENQDLKEELYKAQMLIAVYEDTLQ